MTVVNDNAPSVAVGSTVTISSSNLDVTDSAYSAPKQLIYTVTSGPAYGTLFNGGSSTTQFTQADINAGAITYKENGAAVTSDRFTAMVVDPSGNNTTVTLTQL
jgi:hypothetical protein